jgi:lauroyl/myristoyl acyltransferase
MSETQGRGRGPLGFRVTTWILARTPRVVLVGAAQAGGLAHYAFSRRKRANRAANLAFVPAERRGAPWRPFQAHALNILELLRTAAKVDTRLLSRMTLHGEEHLRSALDRGRGVILATYHSGNWELAGLMLADRGYPVTTVAGEQLRPGWSEPVKSLKERFGIRVLRPGAGLRALYRDIRANRAAVLHVDGDVFAGGYEVTLLGQRVSAPRGPAHLSRVLSCPVAFAYCRRTRDARLHVWIEPVIEPPRNAAEEPEWTQALMSRVEKGIVGDPGQWCIFRRLADTVEPVKL